MTEPCSPHELCVTSLTTPPPPSPATDYSTVSFGHVAVMLAVVMLICAAVTAAHRRSAVA